MNTNDEIREGILRHFYEVSKKATLVDRAKCNERMVIIALQTKYARTDIVKNLIYLVQTGWIKQEKINKIPYYIISDMGVAHFEGSSTFQKSHSATGINITNVQGVTVIGDNNFVHQEFNELYKTLDLLKNEVGKSESISDEYKLDYQSELETIKSQLAKREPNKNIIEQAWFALSGLATIDGVMQFYQVVAPLISRLLKR